MTKVQSGLVFIVVGVVLNTVGRIVAASVIGPAIITAARSGSHNPALAILIAFWMIASAVLVLFGLFRVIVGVLSKN